MIRERSSNKNPAHHREPIGRAKPVALVACVSTRSLLFCRLEAFLRPLMAAFLASVGEPNFLRVRENGCVFAYRVELAQPHSWRFRGCRLGRNPTHSRRGLPYRPDWDNLLLPGLCDIRHHFLANELDLKPSPAGRAMSEEGVQRRHDLPRAKGCVKPFRQSVLSFHPVILSKRFLGRFIPVLSTSFSKT